MKRISLATGLTPKYVNIYHVEYHFPVPIIQREAIHNQTVDPSKGCELRKADGGND